MLISDILDKIQKELTELYPPEEARSIAYLLVEHYTKMNRPSLLLEKQKVLDTASKEKILSALESLKKGKPLQYVVGETEFYGNRFIVEAGVLIPRPETEELVDWIIKDNKNRPINLLDIGTGSGCIAISLALALPQAELSAFDISEIALQQATNNASLHKAEVNFVQFDILSKQDYHSKFDVIVSNPPYICKKEKEHMHKNVLDYEPHLALFVENSDPLVFYRAIISFAQKHLSRGGLVYVEINEAFGQETLDLFKEYFSNVELRKDLSGKDRMVKAALN